MQAGAGPLHSQKLLIFPHFQVSLAHHMVHGERVQPHATSARSPQLRASTADTAQGRAAQGVKCIKQFTINIELIPEISTREYNRAINPLIH